VTKVCRILIQHNEISVIILPVITAY